MSTASDITRVQTHGKSFKPLNVDSRNESKGFHVNPAFVQDEEAEDNQLKGLPANGVRATPGVRPPRKRNPKYETTPSRKPSTIANISKGIESEHVSTIRNSGAGDSGAVTHLQLQNKTSSVDKLNEILHQATSKMPKIKGSLFGDDENKMKIRVPATLPGTTVEETNFKNFLPVDDEITESNAVFCLSKAPLKPPIVKPAHKTVGDTAVTNSRDEEESNDVSEIYVNNTFESDNNSLPRDPKFGRSNSISGFFFNKAISEEDYAVTGTCKLMIEVKESCLSDSEPETTSCREPGAETKKSKNSRVRRKLSRKESFLDSLERPKNGKLSRKPSIVQDSLERPVVKKKERQQAVDQSSAKLERSQSALEPSSFQKSFLLGHQQHWPAHQELSDETDSTYGGSGRHYLKTFSELKQKSESVSECESDYTPIEIRNFRQTKEGIAAGGKSGCAAIGGDSRGTLRANSFLLPNYLQKAASKNQPEVGVRRTDVALRKSSSMISGNNRAVTQGRLSDISKRVENMSKDIQADQQGVTSNGLSQGMVIALNLRSKLGEYGKDIGRKQSDGVSADVASISSTDSIKSKLKKLVRTESCDSTLKEGSAVKKYKSVDEVLAQLKSASNMCNNTGEKAGAQQVSPGALKNRPLPSLPTNQTTCEQGRRWTRPASHQPQKSAGLRMLMKIIEEQKQLEQAGENEKATKFSLLTDKVEAAGVNLNR